MINLVILDDQPLFRLAITHIAGQKGNMNILFETATQQELFSWLENHPNPDIVLVNCRQLNDLETIRLLGLRHQSIKTIGISMFTHENAYLSVMSYGASAFFPKSASPERILSVIEEVYARAYNHRKDYPGDAHHPGNQRKGMQQIGKYFLSKNEISFLQLCTSDLTYKEIADRMNISSSTVNNYRESLFDKLGIKNRTGLVLFSISAMLHNPF